MNKNIILFINNLPLSAVQAVRKLEKLQEKKYRIMILRDSRHRKDVDYTEADIYEECDFTKPTKIAEALLPYQNELHAVTCRSESNIARFISVIPHIPYLRTPSTESLHWATDKYEMRKRFRLFDPKHTPRFTLVKDNSKVERARIISKIGFPLIVKPTNLAASALVHVCYHEEELEKTLRTSFRKLRSQYAKDSRVELPKLMAEEYIEGDMYSIDSYVNSRGFVSHCPIVKVTTGKNIGHDDFYNYLRITPTNLKKESLENAQKRVEIGIHALGLRNTTVHSEVLRVDNDWKIIEIGPRIGGFRHTLHELSCDIDHSLNDILTRIPLKPIIPKKCKGYAAVMRYYANTEGVVEQMTGLKKLKELNSYKEVKVKAKIGDRVSFAKNGGKGVFDLTLFNVDRSKLLADIRRVEKMVNIKIAHKRRGVSKKNTKSSKKNT